MMTINFTFDDTKIRKQFSTEKDQGQVSSNIAAATNCQFSDSIEKNGQVSSNFVAALNSSFAKPEKDN